MNEPTSSAFCFSLCTPLAFFVFSECIIAMLEGLQGMAGFSIPAIGAQVAETFSLLVRHILPLGLTNSIGCFVCQLGPMQALDPFN